MPRDHFISPTVPSIEAETVRAGAGNAENQRWDYREVGKLAKLVGESRYDLAAVGNDIEAQVYTVELAPQNGFTIASVKKLPKMNVMFDGLQATPGVGVIAIGDIVVVGSVTARGTALTTHPKVCRATTPANVVWKYRVCSLGTAGTGAVGTVGVIERI